MTDEFDRRTGNPHDRQTTNQAGLHRKEWRAPKIISSEFADTETAAGNAVEGQQIGDNRPVS
jgi:hypothetical protein